MKIIDPALSNCRKFWIYWLFDGRAQIGYDGLHPRNWGYCDQYKKYGIRELGTYERTFFLGRFWLAWYDYYSKHPEALEAD